ncbi:MAG TPA: SBBP repeat-containing protein, partial [Bacteroidales bacterium]|nr:SBBP repeat-containing protein [Bacteroidales bacterium]
MIENYSLLYRMSPARSHFTGCLLFLALLLPGLRAAGQDTLGFWAFEDSPNASPGFPIATALTLPAGSVYNPAGYAGKSVSPVNTATNISLTAPTAFFDSIGVSFYYRNIGASAKTMQVFYNTGSGDVLAGSVSLPITGTYTLKSLSLPAAVWNAPQVTFRCYMQTTGSWSLVYFDNFLISGKYTEFVVSAIQPSVAPPGTLITLTGSGFSGLTGVKYGSLSASFQLLSPTQLLVTLPLGASASLPITLLGTGKYHSPQIVQLLQNQGSCYGGTNLILSELCDPNYSTYQSDRFIEIFNPTAYPVNLTGWQVIALSNRGLSSHKEHTWNLSGYIYPGQAMTCGSKTPFAGGPHNFWSLEWVATDVPTSNAAWDWNGQERDGAILVYQGVTIDSILPDPNSGNSFFENNTRYRNPNRCSPDTSVVSGWTLGSTLPLSFRADEPPATPRSHTVTCVSNPFNWTAHPQGDTACAGGSLGFSLGITLGGYGAAWQWYALRPGQSGWDTLVNGAGISGATDSVLLISPATAAWDGAQFYCEVTAAGSGCSVASRAVQARVYRLPFLDSMDVVAVSCAGASDGSVTLWPDAQFTAGAGYQWSHGPLTQNIAGLSGGAYTLTFTSSEGCSQVFRTFVREPGGLNTGADSLTFPWLSSFANAFSTDNILGTTVDAGGNILMTGSFSGSLTLGTTTLVSSGGTDMFLLRFSPTGSLLWARRAGGGSSDAGTSVATDLSGNIYVSGSYRGNASFGTTSLDPVYANDADFFLACYDAGGNLRWVNKGGSYSFDLVPAVRVSGLDPSTLLLGGSCFSQTQYPFYYDGNVIASGNTQRDPFLLRVSALDGRLVWGQVMTGSGSGYGMAVEERLDGRIFMAGDIDGVISIPGQSYTSTGNDVFCTGFLADGTAVSLAAYGSDGGGDQFSALVLQPDGSPVLGMTIDGTIHLNGNPLSSDAYDGLVLGLDAAGAVSWYHHLTGADLQFIRDMVATTDGRIWIGGSHESQLLLDTFQFNTFSEDIFLIGLTSLGGIEEVLALGGSGSDRLQHLDALPGGELLFTGDFSSSAIQFGPHQLSNPSSPNLYKPFFGSAQVLSVAGTAQVVDESCAGSLDAAITVEVTGGSPPYQYQWSNGAQTPSLTGLAGNQTYGLTITDASGCSLVRSFTPGQGALPSVSITPTANPVCSGSAVSLSGPPNMTYAWSTGSTQSVLNLNPTQTITYGLTATDQYGCSNTASLQLTVNPLPTVDAGADRSICFGESTTLNATGNANSYTWTSLTGNPLIVSPLVNTTYTVVASSALGCTATDQVTVTVKLLPGVNAGQDQSICYGGSAVLTAVGNAASYAWSGYAGNPITVSPGNTTTYTVTAISSGSCTATDQVVVTVNPLPIVNGGLDVAICFGESTVLTATGNAAAYSWTGYSGNPLTVNPANTTTYTVVGNSAANCSAADQVTVTVNPLPIVNAGQDVAICFSESAVLTATGNAATYAWTGYAGNPVTVNPTNNTTYTVVGSSAANCSAADQVTVTVNPLPIVNAGQDVAICFSESAVLTATGNAATYAWTGYAGNPVTVNPTNNTTYTVVGSSAANCSAADQVTVTVNPLPIVNAGQDVVICYGESTLLTATGNAASYAWTGYTGNPVTVNPTNNTIYTVVGSSAANCSAADQVTVTVNPLPIVNAGQDVAICYGESTLLTATGNAAGYSWTGYTGNPVTVNPTNNTTYTVVGSSAANCSAADQVTVTVNPLPFVNAGQDVAICAGESAVLTASGNAAGYSWTGYTGNPVTVNPTNNTTYTVVGSSAANCSAADQVTVTVNPLPIVNAGQDVAICYGESTLLTATGNAASYAWTGYTGNPVTVNPTNNTIYTVVGSSAANCSAADQVTVTVNPLPIVNAGQDV